MASTAARRTGAGTETLLRRSHDGRRGRGGLDLPAAPRLRVAVLTCMDARLMVEDLLGLQPGEAHVIRNAGGTVTDDVIRSLAISQRRLGTREVMVVRHTDCGMQSLDEDAFIDELTAHAGTAPPWRPQAFGDLRQSLAGDIARLTADPFLAKADRIRGFVFDMGTGALDEVPGSFGPG